MVADSKNRHLLSRKISTKQGFLKNSRLFHTPPLFLSLLFHPTTFGFSVLYVILLMIPFFSYAERKIIICSAPKKYIFFVFFYFHTANAIWKSLTWFNNRMIFKKSCSLPKGKKTPIFHRLSSDDLKSVMFLFRLV